MEEDAVTPTEVKEGDLEVGVAECLRTSERIRTTTNTGLDHTLNRKMRKSHLRLSSLSSIGPKLSRIKIAMSRRWRRLTRKSKLNVRRSRRSMLRRDQSSKVLEKRERRRMTRRIKNRVVRLSTMSSRRRKTSLSSSEQRKNRLMLSTRKSKKYRVKRWSLRRTQARSSSQVKMCT